MRLAIVEGPGVGWRGEAEADGIGLVLADGIFAKRVDVRGTVVSSGDPLCP